MKVVIRYCCLDCGTPPGKWIVDPGNLTDHPCGKCGRRVSRRYRVFQSDVLPFRRPK